VEVEEFASEAGLGSFFRGGEFPLGEGNAAFLGDDFDGFWKADIFNFADEAEDISGGLAAEAVVELFDGLNAEGAGFFLVKRAEAGVPLGTRFAQADVALDDPDDVGLLLYGLGEVGHGGSIHEDKAGGHCAHLCK
jgi:hypothetical protein